QMAGYDPCMEYYVEAYLNTGEVQEALHARTNTNWLACPRTSVPFHYTPGPVSVVPTIRRLVERGLSIWVYRWRLGFHMLDYLDEVLGQGSQLARHHAMARLVHPGLRGWRICSAV
uniref:Uncharacterized protein n=1 Tax=Aegilops tauschii subsp. strangulata TaxID=200361 RepID=A0A453L092_AEGTS